MPSRAWPKRITTGTIPRPRRPTAGLRAGRSPCAAGAQVRVLHLRARRLPKKPRRLPAAWPRRTGTARASTPLGPRASAGLARFDLQHAHLRPWQPAEARTSRYADRSPRVAMGSVLVGLAFERERSSRIRHVGSVLLKRLRDDFLPRRPSLGLHVDGWIELDPSTLGKGDGVRELSVRMRGRTGNDP